MSTLSIEIPTRMKAELAAAARRLGVSTDRFVREILRANLKAPPTAHPRTLYERSRDLCGSVNGGPPDLARNREHLKGYGSWKR
ncbi:MAG: hypothetical protein HYY24_10575 [Verrucomicrobia bacterium]|nr:hypothetical protein [Verrucomicrobiota bacterium]